MDFWKNNTDELQPVRIYTNTTGGADGENIIGRKGETILNYSGDPADSETVASDLNDAHKQVNAAFS